MTFPYIPDEMRTQFFGADESYSTVDWTTPGVVKSVNPNMANQLEVTPSLIHLKSGDCPDHFDAAQSESGLTTIQITAPAGVSFIYRERDNYRIIRYSGTGNIFDPFSRKCDNYSYGSWSANKVLSPGQVVQIRVRKAGKLSDGNGQLWAKDIELVSVQTKIEEKPPTPDDGGNGGGEPPVMTSWMLPLAVLGGTGVAVAVLVIYALKKP